MAPDYSQLYDIPPSHFPGLYFHPYSEEMREPMNFCASFNFLQQSQL